jgi:predicted AlkP superfamily phosphohydrolase/phosphomutase
MIIGVDGMDPRLTRKYVDEGKLPNIKKLIEQGAQRHDLVLLGSQPTVTPPQWATLATGANPVVHGICQFGRTIPGRINHSGYNLDSRLCKAEPVWNCFAEAGKKTCVFHWPGGAWPPTSTNENLYVIDGSSPGSIGSAAMQVDTELIIGANPAIEQPTFVPKAASDAVAPCVIEKLPDDIVNAAAMDTAVGMQMSQKMTDETISQLQKMGRDTINIIKEDYEGFGVRAGRFNQLLNVAQSPIKDASGWAAVPEGAKEFTILLCGGFIRRPALILKNEDGIYDRVAVYKSKTATEPLAECEVGKMVYNIVDEVIRDDKRYLANRHYMLISLADDASELRMYFSAAMDMNCDTVIHPKRLAKALIENVGPFPPQAQMYTQDKDLQDCQLAVWDYVMDYYADAFVYLIEKEGVENIWSHMHSIDFLEHTFIRYMKDHGFNIHPEETYAFWMERLYKQIDYYLGRLIHYLDEGWTIVMTSDHAQVCPTHTPPRAGDMCGVNVGLMEELGYTVLKRDENGNRLKQIDWSKTKAIQSQGNDIYINLKGREPYGIVEPEDKYELEEQIMTDLYGYKDPETGKRVIALALRNKDAVLLGYGGPTAGDIFFANAEGYNYDHTDSLSTTYGEGHTSSSPIFIAAGPGFKKGFETDRIIRQVDLAPTMAILGGVRIPAQCEGAPIYQILEEEL